MPLNHRGFGAYITCDGKEIEQYGVQVEDEKLISCWIPSEADKEFEIYWVDYMGETYSSATLMMDGRTLESCISSLGGKSSSRGWYSSASTLRPFKFTKLTLTDDDNVASAKAQVSEDIGTIEVKIRRISDLGSVNTWTSRGFNTSEIAPVHERSKKAGTNCVTLSTDVQVAPITLRTNVQYLDADSYVIFRFRHRSEGMLQANGIMPPPPPSSAPSPSVKGKDNKKRPSNEGSSSGANPAKRLRIEPGNDEPLVISDDDEDDVNVLKAQLVKIQKKLEKKEKKLIVKHERSPIRVANHSHDVIEIFSD